MTGNYLLWFILKPSQLILLGALLSVVFWRRPASRTISAVTVGLLILFGLVPTGGLLIEPLQARFVIPSSMVTIDGIIVLAGSEQVVLSQKYSEPQLGDGGDRLTTFLMLAARYPQARLIHSGSPAESNIARALILGTGVAQERIRFDEASRNTCDSARSAQTLVTPQPGERWLLVTSAFHMPRSIACFRAVGWDVTAYPTDYRRALSRWSPDLVANLEDLDLAAHEWLGLLYYRLRGRTNELFPGPSRS